MRRLLGRLITGGPGYTTGRPNEPQDVALRVDSPRFAVVFKQLLMFAPVQDSCAVFPCLIKLPKDCFVLFEGNHGAYAGVLPCTDCVLP